MISVLLALLQAAPAGADLPSEPGPGDVFDVVPVAEGVWAAVVKPGPAAYAFANSLVVEGEDGLLVVDTQQSPTAARALIRWIRDRGSKPVRWVVNTHAHGDHVYGNEAYRTAFPDVRVVGHVDTRTGVLEETAANREREISELPASIEERGRWLETGVGPGGEALDGEDRAAVARSLALRRAYLADLRELRLVPPDATFTDRMVLHLGGRPVELIHLGPAHTRGDVVVRLPEEGVVAVGDLLEEGPPWVDGAWIPGWARALERLRETAPRRILPSHGSLQDDATLLEWQADFLAALVGGAEAARREGWGVSEAVERARLERFRESFASVGVEGEALERYLDRAMEEAMADVAAGDPSGR